jgi:plasmid stabilization system protein ParE
MAQVTWSPRAIRHLHEICEYIAQTSEQNAEAFGNNVRNAVSLLAQQPRLGAKVPEYNREDVREILVQKHRILYRLQNEDVEILSVIRGARRLPRTPPG